jgi:hypothetical protein
MRITPLKTFDKRTSGFSISASAQAEMKRETSRLPSLASV